MENLESTNIEDTIKLFFSEDNQLYPSQNFGNISQLSKSDDENEQQTEQDGKQQLKSKRKYIKKQKKYNDQDSKMLVVKNMQVKAIQLYLNEIVMKTVFAIQGDYFIDLNYNRKQSLEDQINYFKGYKQVQCTAQNDQKGILYIDVATNDLIQYTPYHLIENALQQRQDPLLLKFCPLIHQYFKQLELNKQRQEKLNQIMSQSEIEEIRLKRRIYYDQQMQEFLSKTFDDTDFFVVYNYQQNRTDEPFLQYRQVGVSYPLIALLGTDPQSFSNICLRQGFLEFTSSQQKQLQFLNSMACRLGQYDQSNIYHQCNTIRDTTLLTFDEYEIQTQINIIGFRFEYPPELQLVIDGQQLIQEIPCILHYLIDENTISSLIAKRVKNPQFKADWENEEFGYTMESQIFLEKFYNGIQKQFKSQQQQHQNTTKYYYNKQCGYRNIINGYNQNLKQQCCSHYKSLF